ncbi:hypothetical protein BN77_1740 [Rhizobium mesoamericanum STM3625]|uniref:Uncharacterized protein n=1 Tax=Rhizobium mesoamericanum STM3625 TaxID=1211777 RepID=K0PL09_9HYPH|nr:hypothetical protein BN77_1740 [Rhizobium mesoamericanum STM3625]
MPRLPSQKQQPPPTAEPEIGHRGVGGGMRVAPFIRRRYQVPSGPLERKKQKTCQLENIRKRRRVAVTTSSVLAKI